MFDPAPDLVTGVRMFFAGAAAHLEETDYEDACPIATVALEVSSSSETMRLACADVFESWIDEGTELHAEAGIDPDTARELTIAMIAALEGAFVLARALREHRAAPHRRRDDRGPRAGSARQSRSRSGPVGLARFRARSGLWVEPMPGCELLAQGKGLGSVTVPWRYATGPAHLGRSEWRASAWASEATPTCRPRLAALSRQI